MSWGKKDTFKEVRSRAAQGVLVTVRPDGKYQLLPALKAEAIKPQLMAHAERLMPSSVKRNVAVIGDTSWAESTHPTLQAANESIPFFGLLMGIATIGHSVWIFNGEDKVLEDGCREADVLIVDSAQLTLLPPDWKTIATKTMRNPETLVHDRARYQLRRL